jgi:hypothetical protein
MEELLEQFQNQFKKKNKIIPRDAQQLISKISSFVYSPQTRKDAERIKKFINTKDAEENMIRVMKDHKIWIMEDYLKDIITYWYFISFLLQKKSKTGIAYVGSVASNLLKHKSSDLSLMKRYLDMFPEIKELSAIRKKINDQFEKLSGGSDATKWANRIGLEVPAKWKLSFHISDNKKATGYWNIGDKGYSLNVKIFSPPYGNGISWKIHLSSPGYKASGSWEDKSNFKSIIIKDYIYDLNKKPSLLEFPDFLSAVEKKLKVRFSRKIYFLYKTKGIKNLKALDNWLASF